MKKIQVTLLTALFLSGMATAQSQLENSGFEQWDDILISEGDTIREPVEWSSLKTSDIESLSDFAPVVCKRSSDAHSGDYSVELTNIEVFSIVANGTVSNGRYHPDLNPELAYIYSDTLDGNWNTPLIIRPDSIAGWFKYVPQENDTLQVIVALHRGYAKQPETDKTVRWIGEAEYKSSLDTGDEWVRFSAPFTYYSDSIPEYVLVVLNSGSGYTPVAGSMARFDDLEMVYNYPSNTPNRLKQPMGSVYVVDHQHLVLQGMEYTRFQTIRIHDLTGKLFWDGTIVTDRVDVSSANLKTGIYVVTLTGKRHVFSQKIMLF
jgi:hypothetical protein